MKDYDSAKYADLEESALKALTETKTAKDLQVMMLEEELNKPLSGGVHVTTANGYSLGISSDDRLVYFPSNKRTKATQVDVGPATKKNISTLIYALERLQIHASDN
jgi:hypothetical protein